MVDVIFTFDHKIPSNLLFPPGMLSAIERILFGHVTWPPYNLGDTVGPGGITVCRTSTGSAHPSPWPDSTITQGWTQSDLNTVNEDKSSAIVSWDGLYIYVVY